MDNKEYALEWLRFAEMDLSSAEFLTGKRPLPLEIICFHCQQSAEKCLKGLLVINNIQPPKTHDLRELYNLCLSVIGTISAIQSPCIDLNLYSVQPRYPLEIQITEDDMTQALANAGAIMEFAKPLIGQK